MNYRPISMIRIWLMLIGVSIIASGCSPASDSISSTPIANLYSLDPVLREFYDYMGGEVLLGQVISAARNDKGVTSQFTSNCLLIFDTQAPDSRRFQFGSLGRQLIISPLPGTDPQVAEPFKEIYEQLGPIFTGKPLTGLVYNQEKDQYEQYFENLGFFKGATPDSQARLLPYGAWTCGLDCLQSIDNPASPDSQPTIQASPTALQEDTGSNASSTPSPGHQWTIQAWEKAPSIAANQEQEFRLKIERDGLPADRVVAVLSLELPNGLIMNFEFPATDTDGNTALEVASLETLLDARSDTEGPSLDPSQLNGMLIPYQICLTGSKEEFCLRDSYLIWEQP